MLKYKYIFSIAVLLIGFFFLTGGINDPNEINTVSIDDLSATGFDYVYDQGTITMRGTEGYYKYDCTKFGNSVSKLKITKNDVVIYHGGFDSENDGVYKYQTSFMFPGTYQVIATQFPDGDDPDLDVSIKTISITVNSNTAYIEPGTFVVTEFSSTCLNSPITGSDLNGSSLILSSQADTALTATLNLNITFPVNVDTSCIKVDQYKNKTESGTVKIEKNTNGTYEFWIMDEIDGVEAGSRFAYTKNGNIITLNYSKNGKNYSLKLEKQ